MAAVFDWLFRNRQTGRITVVQVPNASLAIFLVAAALRWVVPSDTAARTTLGWVGVTALAAWAVDEVVRGVNPWRRILGFVGCSFAVAGVMSMLG
jgi:hypothetical protein